jgi:hypothetical protein
MTGFITLSTCAPDQFSREPFSGLREAGAPGRVSAPPDQFQRSTMASWHRLSGTRPGK